MITNDTLTVIKQRRSVRSYRDEQIKPEELEAILEAGLYAPNAGDQAWHFTVVQNRDLLRRLDLAAKDGARQLSIEHLLFLANDEQFDCLYGAPTLIIVSGDHSSPVPLDADCAAATENMLIAAETLGIGSCWIFFVQLAFVSTQGDELREELKMPEGHKPYTSAVFGYKRDEVVEVPARKPNLITVIR